MTLRELTRQNLRCISPTNERVCGSRASGENQMNSLGTSAAVFSRLSNSAEISVRYPVLDRSARNSCEWNRAANEFEPSHDTGKFGLSSPVKLRNAKPYAPKSSAPKSSCTSESCKLASVGGGTVPMPNLTTRCPTSPGLTTDPKPSRNNMACSADTITL